MANVNANINVNIQTQQAAAQLRKLSADISRFNEQSFSANSAAAQQQRALNQALIDGVKTSGQFKTSIVPITSAVDRFATSIEKGKLSLGQYTRYAASQLPGMRRIFQREFDMIGKVAEQRVKTLNTQFVALGDSANGAQRALAITPRSLDQYSASAQIALQRTQIFNQLLRDGSTQLLNWGKNTQWAGRQLMVGFTIPLGIMGAQAAKIFKELEAEAVNFRKVYGDIFTTDAEVEKNLQAVKQLSEEMTKYGISIQQTFELANVAAQSGARSAELIAQTTEATRLAVLGQMEQQEAIKTTITLQNAFRLSNDELADSINFLNVVENQSVLSLQDVSGAIPRVAPVIKSLGGDVQDLSVMLVAMREGGVSAAEGANALKTSLSRLISPTAGAVSMASKFGISLNKIVVDNKGDILGAVMELADAMKTLDELSQQQLMSEIFGKRQYARIGALFNNITNEASQAQRVMELTKMSTTELALTAEKELSNVEESVTAKFTGAMERAKLSLAPVGEEFLKALTPVVDAVGKILTKFSELPDGIKTAIVAATGIIGGIAPIVLMVTGLVANGIANIAKFILFLRKQVATLRGNGEQFKFYTSAELEAAAAAASLEGKTSSLTKTMALQKPAIETLIVLYQRLAASARNAAAAMPATMGGLGVGVPLSAATRGGGFAAVAPRLPVAYRNAGGEIFESGGGKTRVPGSGNTDTVPAMLTPGEFVINKKATKENLPLIKAINDGVIKTSNQSAKIPSIEPQIQKAFGGAFIAKFMSRAWYSAQGRQSAPANLRNAVPQTIRNKMESDLEKVLIKAGIDTKNIPAKTWKDMVKADLAHIKPEVVDGKKVWRLKNLMNVPGLENNGLNFLFGQRNIRNKEMFKEIANSNPKFFKNYKSQIKRIIEDSQHPVTSKDYKFLQELFQMFESSAIGANWLGKQSKTAKYWYPALKALVNDRLNPRDSVFGLPLPIPKDKRFLDKKIEKFNTGGYVGSSSMYDKRYARGQSGSRVIDRLKNSRMYKYALQNVKATTSYRNRNRKLKRFRPSDPRTFLDYAIPRQHNFVSMPTPVPINRVARFEAANDLDGKFVRSYPGTSVGSRYQYKEQPKTGIPYLDSLHDRAGIKGYDLVPAPQSVLRDKYGRFVSREEYDKRQRYRQILSTTSNSQIRKLMRKNEMQRRKNYRKGAYYRFGDDAIKKEAPLYNPGPGLSSRLGQNRGREEMIRDRESGIKPVLVSRPDDRSPREKQKSIKVKPGERVVLPGGQVYTNTSRNTVYLTNPYYRPRPGKHWVNPETGIPYQLGGQADVDRATTFRSPTLSKTTNPANLERLAYLGWPFAQTEARKVNRTGEFSAFGFNRGGRVPEVQRLWGGGMARYLMSPFAALKKRSARNANIYFRSGVSEYDDVQEMSIMAYKKRRILKDKKLAGLSAIRHTPSFGLIPQSMSQPTQGQMHMFTTPADGRFSVNALFARKGYESLSPTLMGVLARESFIKTGLIPTSQSSLSQYSGKIYNRLIDLGILNAKKIGPEDFNGITKWQSRSWLKDIDKELNAMQKKKTLSQKDLSLASDFVRFLIRNAPNKKQTSFPKQSPQKEFEQLGLFKAPTPAKVPNPIDSIQKDFLAIINGPKGMQNSKQFGNLGAKLLELQNRVGVTRESEELLLQIGRAFNRSKAMGLNKGGRVPKEFLKQSIKLNDGNTVPGVGNTDTVPAMLTPGEFVVNKQATQENLPLLHAINDGKTQKLQRGGQTSNPYKQGFLKQIRSMDNPRLRAAFERQYLLAAIGGEAAFRATGSSGYRMPAYGHFSNIDKSQKENWRLGGRNAPGMPISPAENQLQESMRSSSRNRKMFEKYLRQELGNGSKAERQTQKIMQKLEKNQMLSAKEQAVQAKILPKMIADMEKGVIRASEKPIKGQATVSPNLLRTMQAASASYGAREAARTRLAKMEPGYRSRVVQRLLSIRAASGVQPAVGPRPAQPLKIAEKAAARSAASAKETERQARRQERLNKKIEQQEKARAAREARRTDVQRRALEIKKTEFKLNQKTGRMENISTEEAMRKARSEMGIKQRRQPGRFGQAFQRLNSGIGKAGMGLGMGVSMASMLPMMNQDEQGKFMGMDAGKAMMGMMGAGTLLSIMPMLGPAAAPVAAVAAAASVTGFALYKWRDSVDSAARETAEYGANVGVAANAVGNMAKILGKQDLLKSREFQQLTILPEEQEEFASYSQMLDQKGGEGEKFIKELKSATSQERFSKLVDYLRGGIASELLTVKEAKLFAKAVGAQLDDVLLGIRAGAEIGKQRAGSSELLDIAQERESAALDEEKIQKTINSLEKNSLDVSEAAMTVGAGTQIIKSYNEAIAKAQSEYETGSLSFQTLIEMVDKANSSISTWEENISLAYENVNDFSALLQGTKTTLALSGVTEQEQKGLDESYKELYQGIGSTFTSGAQEFFKNSENEVFRLGTEGAFLKVADLAEKAGFEGNMQGVRGYFKSDAFDEEAVREIQQYGQNLKGLMKNDMLQVARNQAVAQLGMDPMTATSIMNTIASDIDALQSFIDGGKTVEAFTDAVTSKNAETMFSSEKLAESFEYLAKKFEDTGQSEAFRSYLAQAETEPERQRRLTEIQSLGQGMTPDSALNVRSQFLSTRTVASQYYDPATVDAIQGTAAYQSAISSARQRDVTTTYEASTAYPYVQPPQTFSITTQEFDDTLIKSINKAIDKAGEAGVSGQVVEFALEIADEEGKPAGLVIDEFTKKVEDLQGLDDEIKISLGIDLNSGMDVQTFGGFSEEIRRSWSMLSALNPNIDLNLVARSAMLDEKGKVITDPAKVAKDIMAMNKAYENLEKSKGKDQKRKAQVKLVTEYQTETEIVNEDGEKKKITPSEIVDEANTTLQKIGKNINKLPAARANQILQIQTSLSDVTAKKREEIYKLKQREAELLDQPEMSAADWATLADYAKQIASKEGEIQSIEKDAEANILALGIDSNVPDGNGGGGGGTESPVESFKKSILEQVKMWTDAKAKMKDLTNIKNKFVDQVLKGQGIFDKLRNIKGLPTSILEKILGMGPDGAKEFINKYVKGGKITDAGKALLRASTAAGINETVGMNILGAETSRMQARAATKLRAEGASDEVIQEISGDPKKAAEYLKLQRAVNKGVRGAKKDLKEYLRAQQDIVDATREEEKARRTIQEITQERFDAINLQFDIQEFQLRQQYEEEFAETNGQTVKKMERAVDTLDQQILAHQKNIELKEDEIEKLNRANELDQRRIESYNEQIEGQQDIIDVKQRQNELDQREIEALSRQDEMRQRVADALQRDLDKMSEAEDKIKQSYQERFDALDQVAKVNERIISQQRQQINLSRALSEGDVYAAAQAAEEMRSDSAQFAIDQTRAGLEQSMENEVAGLRTTSGLTRGQAEAQISNIKDQSYQTSLLIRDIEDRIYQRNLEMIPLQDEIYRIKNELILPIEDTIADRNRQIRDYNDQIYNINNELIKPLESQKEAYNEILSNYERKLGYAIADMTVAGKTREDWEKIETATTLYLERHEQLKGVKGTWDQIVEKMAAAALLAPKIGVPDVPIPGTEKNAAGGYISGNGARDSIFSTLTPGEFVVRKSMVKKYGLPMFEKINQGSFAMPRYNLGSGMATPIMANSTNVSNVNAPVYNTYDMKFNIDGTNASADEIAHKVMTKIRNIDSASIRRINGY